MCCNSKCCTISITTVVLNRFFLQILNLLGFICIEASGYSWHSRGAYFNSIAMIGFWFTGILLVFYLFHIIEKFYKVPWLQAEGLFCTIWTLLYLIAASLAVSFPGRNEGYIAGGVSDNFNFIKIFLLVMQRPGSRGRGQETWGLYPQVLSVKKNLICCTNDLYGSTIIAKNTILKTMFTK